MTVQCVWGFPKGKTVTLVFHTQPALHVGCSVCLLDDLGVQGKERIRRRTSQEKNRGTTGNMWQRGVLAQSAPSVFRNWKTVGASKGWGQLAPSRDELSCPFPPVRPGLPSIPHQWLSEPPGPFPSPGQAGNRPGELSACPDPVPAGGVCLHMVIWFQSSEILKLSTGTSSIFNSSRMGWTDQPGAGSELLSSCWGSRCPQPAPSAGAGPTPPHTCGGTLSQFLSPSVPESPRLCKAGLISGSQTAGLQILTPPVVTMGLFHL